VVAEDVAIGVEAGELGKAAGRLDGRDQPELIVPRKRIPGVWRSHGSIKNEAMANVVGGVGTLATEVLAVLWNQYKAGVGAVVDGLRPGVANAVREVVSQALIHVDEQAIVLRIPTRSCFEVDGDRKSANAGRERARDGDGAVDVFQAGLALRIEGGDGAGRIRLIDVEKATEVHAANMKAADADRRVVPWLEFDGS